MEVFTLSFSAIAPAEDIGEVGPGGAVESSFPLNGSRTEVGGIKVVFRKISLLKATKK
jgi:hypothetical protein